MSNSVAFNAKRRAKRVRMKFKFSSSKAIRLSVFRSGYYIYAQLIDDLKGCTLCALSTLSISKLDAYVDENKSSEKIKTSDKNAFLKHSMKNVEASFDLGQKFGHLILKILNTNESLKERSIVFDRGSRQFHGRIKAFATGVRGVGVKF